MGSLDVGVWELIEATCRADDRLLPDKAGECLRTNAFGDEVLQPEHSPGLQEVERTKPLGGGRWHS